MQALSAIVALMLWICAPAGAQPVAKEDLLIPVPFVYGSGGWKVGKHTDLPGLLLMTEFIPEEESIENWHQLFTIANFTSSSWGGATPQETLNTLKEMRERNCPGSTRWQVIANDANSILYEWQSKPCLGWPSQHELARILYGLHNRFQVRYTYKQAEMPAILRLKWIEKLSAVTVERHLDQP